MFRLFWLIRSVIINTDQEYLTLVDIMPKLKLSSN